MLECETHSQLVHRCLLRAISTRIDQFCSEESTTPDYNHKSDNKFDSNNINSNCNYNENNAKKVIQLRNSFHLGNISANTLDTFVNYIYESEILVNDTNALELYNVSVLLNIQFIQDACADYLKAGLDETNCLFLMECCNSKKSGEDDKLVRECIKYAAKHFDKMLEGAELINISPKDLLAILEEAEFTIQDEWKLIEFIHQWINKDHENRHTYTEKLLKQIRFQLLDTIKLLDILDNQDLAIFHQQVKNALIDLGRLSRQAAVAKWDRKSGCTSLPKDTESNCSLSRDVPNSTNHSVTRNIDVYNTTLVCFGGRLSDKQFSTNITCYEINELKSSVSSFSLDEPQITDCEDIYPDDISRQSFSFPYLKPVVIPNLQQMPSIRKGFGAVSLEDKIYLFGGRPKCSLQTGEIYDMSNGMWLPGPKLNTGRSWYGLAELDGLIYAVGGVGEEGSALSSVEMLDPRIEKWHPLSPMLRPRFGFGICSTKEGIAVVGGVNDQTIELYDTRYGIWQPLVKMEEVREASSVFWYNDCIYICGGANGAGCVNRMDIFSMKAGEWNQGKSMILHRAFTATRMWNDYVFLIGGRNNAEPSNLILAYNLKTNEWAVLPQTLPYFASSCCAITTNVL
ncbi:unnamed protein product [Heterobilharzia americana]|nr:unnamed protein product [Heterobilharzia americana]